ncbi:hypothetical protein BJ508DRAFT_315992 [Ascobolus immersus RN42]|uniref:Uncharacterized protein n=1 Tax=Ascobolus immersus RN42 TaxID=1160509 RepID=A0A3N4H8A2_ASCIM|nr:hypothetical protein BJ508DRAFT_315992 [Ascobolus immersus RN42]
MDPSETDPAAPTPAGGSDNDSRPPVKPKLLLEQGPSAVIINQSSPLSKWDCKPSPSSAVPSTTLNDRVIQWIEDQPNARTPRQVGLRLQVQTTGRRRRGLPLPITAPRPAKPDPRALAVRRRPGPVPVPQFGPYPPSPPIMASPASDLTSHDPTEEELRRIGTTLSTSIWLDTARRTSDVSGPMKPEFDTARQPSSPLSSPPSSLDLSNSPTMKASISVAQAVDGIRTATVDGEDKDRTSEGVKREGTPSLPDLFRSSPPPTVHNLQETSLHASSTPDTRYSPPPPAEVIRDAIKIVAAQNLIPALYVLRVQRVRDAANPRSWRYYEDLLPTDEAGGWEYNAQDWEHLLLRFGSSYSEWYKSVVITDGTSVVTTEPVVTTGSPVVTTGRPTPVVATEASSSRYMSPHRMFEDELEELSMIFYPSHHLKAELPGDSSHFPGHFPNSSCRSTPLQTQPPPAPRKIANAQPTPWTRLIDRFGGVMDGVVEPLARRLFSPSKYDPPSRASSTPPEESPPMQDTRTRERRLDDLFGTTPRDSNESDWSRPDPLVKGFFYFYLLLPLFPVVPGNG